ncbi:MAG TPA: nucleotidyltransferase domain-containing protein [Bacillota bacterium]
MATARRHGVIALYLTGSAARGTATTLSDIDFAAWLNPSLEPADRLPLRLELLRVFTRILMTDEVDLAVLNDAAPAVRYHLLRDGRRLFSADEGMRVELETRALKTYFDWLPALRLHQRVLKARLRQGRFADGG